MGGLDRAEQLEADIAAMDLRLKLWSHWCRSGGLNPELWDTDVRSPRQLTTYETRDADKLNLMIMRLPILHRITIQVHYVDRGDPDEDGPREKWKEVNARMRRAGEYKRISKGDYTNVRTRALRIIINSEIFAGCVDV